MMDQSPHCLAVLSGSALASLYLVINERDTKLSLETIKKQEIVVGMTLVVKLNGTLAVQPHIDFIPVTDAVPGAGTVALVVDHLSSLQNVPELIHSTKKTWHKGTSL